MSAKKTISNTFTVNTVEDGESAPYYFQEWFAWSNNATTASVTTAPVISGTWATSIPTQGSYAYLWRKSIRYVWNDNTRQYTAETPQYFRMSGTNGTSIDIKGTVLGVAYTDTEAEEFSRIWQNGDKFIYYTGSSWLLYTNVNGSAVSSSLSDGDAYTSKEDGHLYMYSAESSSVIDIGEFKGESGKTYYTHIAWATNVDTSTSPITVTGFTTAKSSDDTTLLWMGVLVNESSGADPSDATSYTWSYTKGVDGKNGTIYDISFEEAWCRVDNDGIISAALRGYAYKVSGETRTLLSSVTIRYGYKPDDRDTYAETQTNSSGYFDVEDWFDGDKVDDYAKGSNQIFAAIVVNGNMVCTKYVTMAYDGQAGQTGQRGKVGRFFYYSGFDWNANNNTDVFIITEAQAPYFSKAGSNSNKYYVFNPETIPAGGSMTMAQMWAASGQSWNSVSWEVMTDDFKYLITEAMFGKYAHLGSFIINDDWMISTNGTIGGTEYINGENATVDGVTKPAYTFFDANHPSNNNNGKNFIPNLAIDARTGAGHLAKGNITFDTDGNVAVNDANIKGSLMYRKVVMENQYDYLAIANSNSTIHTSLKGDTFIVRGSSTFIISFPPAYLFAGAQIKIVVGQESDLTYRLSIHRLNDEESMIPYDQHSAGWPPYNCFYAAIPITSYEQTEYGRLEYLELTSADYHCIELVSVRNPDAHLSEYYVWMIIDAK